MASSNRPLDRQQHRSASQPPGAATIPVPGSPAPRQRTAVRRTVIGWGLVVGVGTAATPAAFWWLPPATVYAVAIAFIAAVYLGFAVADGRPHVIAVETAVVGIFVVVAALAIASSPWLVVVGLAGHGVKDWWQHHTHFVAGTRWWPPFCATVDWVAAVLVTVALIAGVPVR